MPQFIIFHKYHSAKEFSVAGCIFAIWIWIYYLVTFLYFIALLLEKWWSNQNTKIMQIIAI